MTREDWRELGRCFVPFLIAAAIAVPLTVLIFGLIGGHL